MATDLRLLPALHHEVYTKLPTNNTRPTRLLVQIYSNNGMVAEAALMLNRLLEKDRLTEGEEGLDEETFNTLSPAVWDALRQQGNRSIYMFNPFSRFGLGNYPTEAPISPEYYRERFIRRRLEQSSTRPPPSGREKVRNFFKRLFPVIADIEKYKRAVAREREAYQGPPSDYIDLQEAQQAADTIVKYPGFGLDFVITRFVFELPSRRRREPKLTDDGLRSVYVALANTLTELLPSQYSWLPSEALMHFVHENLNPTYANSKTMKSKKPVSSIPRDRFFASEDNYAWDMAELVAALNSNPAASLCNPLSHSPFTQADVTAIVKHPLGRNLGATQVCQIKFKCGARRKAVDRLNRLSRIMLTAEDSMEAGQEAIDDLSACMATLPKPDTDALGGLSVSAGGRRIGWGYGWNVGEMLWDAKANKVRGNRAGDFLNQIVMYSRRLR